MKRTLVAVLLALALISSACGDDDAGTDTAATEEATEEPAPTEEATEEPAATEEATEGPAPTEEAAAGPADDALAPVRIGLINQENDPIGSFPEMRIGIEGAVKYINENEGGIDGHPIELVTCVQNSPESAQECAQQLATDDLVSVINGINIWTFTFDFYGTMGETPVIGGLPLFASDYNAPNARYFNGGSVGVYAAMAYFLGDYLGAKKIVVLGTANPATDAAVDLGLKPLLDHFGVEYTKIDLPQPLTDATPQLTEVAGSDADYYLLLAAGAECIPVIRAAQALEIPQEKWVYSTPCAAAEIYAEVGDYMVGSWMHRGGFVPEDPWVSPEIQQLFDEFDVTLAEYAPEAPDAPFTGLGWVTMLDVADLFRSLGYDALADPANIFAATDDGQPRGRTGSFGWACTYADIDLASLCSGDNLFVTIAAADGTSEEPPYEGFWNGLKLLQELAG
jgi:branched-chain amino acid transport system substrate-binding protein